MSQHAAITEDAVRAALASVTYPGFSRSIVSFGLVKDVEVKGNRVAVRLEMARPNAARASEIERAVRAALARLGENVLADVTIGVAQPAPAARETSAPHASAEGVSYASAPPRMAAPAGAVPRGAPPPGLEMGGGVRPRGADPWASRAPLEGVRQVVAVASGKGGVGKSTIAVNLALALSRLGVSTGLLDLDIYGPSVPTMMGINNTPEVEGQDTILPLQYAGLKIMSIGFLLGEEAPVIWRGPMVMQMVMQFLRKVKWAPLDLLVVDLPPGTGDTQLTLVQNVPLDGVVVVTTPSDVALIDVRRALTMFEKVATPVIGVVENMSLFRCPHCHETSYIFSKGGGARVAEESGVPFLGEIPLDGAIRAGGDEGRPVMLARPGSAEAAPFLALAQKTLEAIRTGAAEQR
jgi:ATP-binding protein involved in chromosome partitioning